MEIPPKGWGAVEILIWNHKLELEKLGHKVDIFNTKDLEKVAREINSSDYDFIHVQYDDFVGYFSRTLKPPFCATSHYGYILKNPDNPNDPYQKTIFKDALGAPGIIALSPQIAEKYAASGYKGFLRYLRNGTDVRQFSFKKIGNGKALCLGKIESRKQQSLMAKLFGNEVRIDFAGPMADEDFKETRACKYLGEWSKETLHEKLTDYSCLVLLSKGEAAPLVVVEALAAGLSVVISESSTANLDKKPFIDVVPDLSEKTAGMIAKAINTQIKENAKHRESIRKYAEERFDWKVIVSEYESIIKDFISAPRPRRVSYLSVLRRKIRSKFLYQKHQLRVRYIPNIMKIAQDFFLITAFKRYISRQKQTASKVGIIFIGTGSYFRFFPHYYESCRKNFLPDTEKKFVVFTDKTDDPYLKGKPDIETVFVSAEKWPFPTLKRFAYILSGKNHFSDCSHIIYIDADMYMHSEVLEKEFFNHNKPLFGVEHPGFMNETGTFERNPLSLAFVSPREKFHIYRQGCFWGGKKNAVLAMAEKLSENTEKDLSKNIIAIYWDESHLNRYFIDNEESVHTLEPSYAYPEHTRYVSLPYPKKIIHIRK